MTFDDEADYKAKIAEHMIPGETIPDDVELREAFPTGPGFRVTPDDAAVAGLPRWGPSGVPPAGY